MDKMRVNQECIRAREIVAKLKLNNQKAHELIYTARNLLTVNTLMREEFIGQCEAPLVDNWGRMLNESSDQKPGLAR